jgi:gamma-glutamylcyclotransferase (GGCT)/AIG2-like uncharacterized protein YtfP
VQTIFVYGTLKQGEVRAPLWPHPPQRIEAATTRGRLYDLGPYPAMVEGDDLIAGELWHIAPEHLEETLTTLDRIECCNQGGVDLYVRKTIACRTLDGGEERQAHTYLYSDEAVLRRFPAVSPDGDGLVRWSKRA